ncbi:MAG: peptide ABC transporter substrate-binding protein [Anaerolineales bacterium]|nr:MAG: peptide ABC transporter substrate-binding protein [Anaerolineales bacterium]
MYSRKTIGLMMLLLALTMPLAACQPAEQLASELNWNLGTEPPTLDPALGTDSVSIQCDEVLFLGLTDFADTTDAEVIPEVATKWSVSDDGLTWTFEMRKDVWWVHYDPETKKAEKKRLVTAHDVAYGVKRTVLPETASDYAYVSYIIKGAEAVNTGESTDLDSVGVRAVDDYTVEFTLEQPAGYFPAIASMWVNRPVPKEPIEEHGDLWTEAGNIWSNGPYLLDTWEHENRMVFVKNPYYYGANDVSIEQVNCVMVVEDSTAFAMYENGELDVQNPPLDDMDRVKADPVLSKELYIAPRLCTYFYGYNTTKPPLDNVLVRKALSYAIDRQKLIDTVLKGGQAPAWSLACPGIFGNVAGRADFPGITFDPEKARELLAEAGYAGGEGWPDVTLMFNTSEGHQRIAEFIQAGWKEQLGIDVTLANQEFKVYLKTVVEDAPQIHRDGWCTDYPDQNNWVLELFHPTKSPNQTKWSGQAADEFARLTEQAALESEPEKRKELYFEAEKILCVDEAVIAPIYYYTRVVCNKPYVERTYQLVGGQHWEKWKIKAH